MMHTQTERFSPHSISKRRVTRTCTQRGSIQKRRRYMMHTQTQCSNRNSTSQREGWLALGRKAPTKLKMEESSDTDLGHRPNARIIHCWRICAAWGKGRRQTLCIEAIFIERCVCLLHSAPCDAEAEFRSRIHASRCSNPLGLEQSASKDVYVCCTAHPAMQHFNWQDTPIQCTCIICRILNLSIEAFPTWSECTKCAKISATICWYECHNLLKSVICWLLCQNSATLTTTNSQNQHHHLLKSIPPIAQINSTICSYQYRNLLTTV